ncbi:hypothetical protein ABZ540_09640 [Nocardia xishanensis]|uniref:hypothetical protein n=1 Tax=Nocardia xishanensis TaxID=238964 RepID=UPI0033DBADDD
MAISSPERKSKNSRPLQCNSPGSTLATTVSCAIDSATVAWRHYAFNPYHDTPPGTTAGLPNVEPGQSLALYLSLAEADSTPVLAVRTVQWPEHFVSAVRATLTRLAAQPKDDAVRIDENNGLHLFVGSERLAHRAGVRCRSTN